MANFDFPSDDFDFFDQGLDLSYLLLNNRISVRYRRSDIRAMIKTHSLLFPQLISVQLIDISSKGAAVHSRRKLRLKGRVSVFLKFNDGRRFTILATVINRTTPRHGLKFDHYQTDLADHLLATQTDLLFG